MNKFTLIQRKQHLAVKKTNEKRDGESERLRMGDKWAKENIFLLFSTMEN